MCYYPAAGPPFTLWCSLLTVSFLALSHAAFRATQTLSDWWIPAGASHADTLLRVARGGLVAGLVVNLAMLVRDEVQVVTEG